MTTDKELADALRTVRDFYGDTTVTGKQMVADANHYDPPKPTWADNVYRIVAPDGRTYYRHVSGGSWFDCYGETDDDPDIDGYEVEPLRVLGDDEVAVKVKYLFESYSLEENLAYAEEYKNRAIYSVMIDYFRALDANKK